MCSSFSDSFSVSLLTGMLVHWETTVAMSSGVMVGMVVSLLSRHCFFASSSCLRSSFSLSRSLAAFSYSWPAIACSFSLVAPSISDSLSFNCWGVCVTCSRARLPASSMRSMALSGRNRSVMYRSDSWEASTSASSENFTLWCTS